MNFYKDLWSFYELLWSFYKLFYKAFYKAFAIKPFPIILSFPFQHLLREVNHIRLHWNSWGRKLQMFFHFSTTCTTSWSRQKIYFFFISVLRSLGPDHVKNNFPIATAFTILAIITIFLFVAATSTTPWLRKKIF